MLALEQPLMKNGPPGFTPEGQAHGSMLKKEPFSKSHYAILCNLMTLQASVSNGG